MSALQKDSEQRIAMYTRQSEVAEVRGDKARWKKLADDEQKILKMIVRVERLNKEGKPC